MAFDYGTLWAHPIPGKIRRRGPEAVTAWAQTIVAAWIAGVDDEITASRQRAAESTLRAKQARDTAAAVDAGEPAELVATRAELETINRAIADALSDEGPPAAA
ncbi:hypothetical protein [Mycobacterium intracellulare]|uniref:hypothetical protein n=1 Tax=Mycobacterium intracellulare TaxID=1767 RepID=UPI001CD91833|nr:hypothetical protein [Mycobacterium intracellulare]